MANAGKDAVDLIQSATESDVCYVSVPDPTKLQLISLSDQLGSLKLAHPNFDFTLAPDGIYIKGPGRIEAEQLRNKLSEFLCGFSQVHLPPNTQNILSEV